jgi:hypothetical protein
MYIGMQYQKKPTLISSVAPQVKVNLMQMQMQAQPREIQSRAIQPRAFGLGGSMIDAVKKSSKGCKSCGG